MVRRVLMVLILALLTVSLAHAEPSEFPAPTGPYQVGSTYRHWIDEAREEVTTPESGDKREVLVRLWYPAEVEADAVPMPVLPFAYAQMPVLEQGMMERSISEDALAEYAAMQSHSFLDAPLAQADAPFPVLLFSHGWGGMPELSTLQLEELASHGYVIAAIYHTFCAAMIFPDGRIVEYQEADPYIAVYDQQFVMDQMALINAEDPERFFTGRLATERFGIFGASAGGAVSDYVCKVDSRCAAYANEDGGIEGEATLAELPPAMLMSAEDGLLVPALEEREGITYSLRFTTFGHVNFSDAVLWPEGNALEPLLGTASAEESLRSVHAYLVAFFDKHMKGIDSPLLDGPSPDFPDVEFESRNIE